jgi:hypothetical protein
VGGACRECLRLGWLIDGFVDLISASLGRIVIELADDLLPRTCQNFRLLCEGQVSS